MLHITTAERLCNEHGLTTRRINLWVEALVPYGDGTTQWEEVPFNLVGLYLWLGY